MALLQSDNTKLRQGDQAPDFSLKNVNGETVSLNDFNGKSVVIIFMCNHCPYVIPKFQEIAELQNEFKDKDVVVIGINPNDPTNYPADSYENMQKVAEEHGFDYYLFDEAQAVAESYGATCTPDPFVFDKEHKLVYHGRINDAMEPDDTPMKHNIREVLNKLVAGEEIEEWFVPSQGCSIKWRA